MRDGCAKSSAAGLQTGYVVDEPRYECILA